MSVQPTSTSDLRSIWPPNTEPDLIGDVEGYIRRYCVLDSACYLPLAVWCVATHLALQFDAFPYLALQSPTKRCGKTRLQEVIEMVCARAWRGAAPTPAALFRMMANCPTLLLDEVEALRTGKHASESLQAVLAVLNAGHRRGATVPRCSGKDGHLEFFPVYGPKAFAAIGQLPDTLADRSIVVTLQRRRSEQSVERFLFGRARSIAEPIHDTLVSWTKEHDESVRAVYESLTDLSFLSDRDADLWMPLFATCSVAAPNRTRELRDCAVVLARIKQADDVDDSIQVRLLADIRQVWPKSAPHVGTSDLLERLRNLDDSPWSELNVTPRRLAKWLGGFKITPRQVRIGSLTVKGYLRLHLDEVFGRYLANPDEKSETCETGLINTGENDGLTSETGGQCFG